MSPCFKHFIIIKYAPKKDFLKILRLGMTRLIQNSVESLKKLIVFIPCDI